MNLSLTVSQANLSELHSLSSRGAQSSHPGPSIQSPWDGSTSYDGNGGGAPSPDADVSSNCGTDSSESTANSEGMNLSDLPTKPLARGHRVRLLPNIAPSMIQSPWDGAASDATTISETRSVETALDHEEQLPYPLNEETLDQALGELPPGARLVRILSSISVPGLFLSVKLVPPELAWGAFKLRGAARVARPRQCSVSVPSRCLVRGWDYG